jgi:hypothetical protein
VILVTGPNLNQSHHSFSLTILQCSGKLLARPTYLCFFQCPKDANQHTWRKAAVAATPLQPRFLRWAQFDRNQRISMNPRNVSDDRELLVKVPAIITIYFWIVKILATTVGETGADFLFFNLHFGLTATSLLMSMVLAAIRYAQSSKLMKFEMTRRVS